MYGIIQILLKEVYDGQNRVLIESPFEERTRLGLYCDTVLLAITPNKFVIATKKNREYKTKRYKNCDLNVEDFKLDSVLPLDSISVGIFKRTQRQSLKVVFNEIMTRYFELGRMPKRNIFWKLWCGHIRDIRKGSSLWPYVTAKSFVSQVENTLKWTDKYLYLGSKRQEEDQIQPIPIPGLGPTEEIKLLYLKPEHFGCWDQAEHWVQCVEERETTTPEYEAFTYTGCPTSNVTYTSLMTTLKNLQ